MNRMLCFFTSLFCITLCFAGQNIDVTVNITTDVAGNGNALANGVGPFDQSPIGNIITISSSVTKNVYGSYAIGANVEVSNNIVNVLSLGNVGIGSYICGGRAYTGAVSGNVVNINSFAIQGSVYGAYIDNNGSCLYNIVNINTTNGDIHIYEICGGKVLNEAEEMSRNIVHINIDTGSIHGNIFGAYVSTATAQTVIANNKVVIKVSSGNANDVLGAIINYGECKFEDNEVIVDVNGTLGSVYGVEAANCSADAYNNSVIINNGELKDDERVYGATVDYNGDVVGNSITINNGTFKHNIICGITGRALYRDGTGNAINNTVTINNGVVIHSGGVGGYSIIGGSSGGGDSIGNKIIINGGTINADIIFAAESDIGNAVNNTVTIQGDANVDANLLCGGFVWNNPSADIFTGNTLNLDITGVMVNGLDHFETYNFYLQENRSNTPLITVRKGGSVISDGGGAHATGGAVNLENTNINLYMSSNSKVNVGDAYILIMSTNGIAGAPKNVDNFMQKGLAVYYDCDINITDTELIAQINQDGRVNPVFPTGYSAGIAFSNLGADLVVGAGMQELVKLNNFDKRAVNSFGIFSGQKYNYGDGNSQVNIGGISLLAGLTTKWFDIKSNPFINGLFFEYGSGNFDFKEESINMPLVKSQGSASYAGGGLLGRLDIENNVYCETSIRAGQTRLDCNSADLKDPITGMEAKYNYESLYFGLHLGGGYIHKFNSNLSADFYGKYIYAHQNAKEVVLPTEEKLKFDGINSQRIKVGARFDYLLNKRIISDIYAGIALDHELDGEVKATIDTISSINSNLKGSSVAGEFGLTKSIGRFNLDLGMQGYVGNKEGLSGALKVVYAF